EGRVREAHPLHKGGCEVGPKREDRPSPDPPLQHSVKGGSLPDAWFNHLGKFVKQGVRCFKMDPQNLIEEHATRRYYNGRSDLENHNLTQVLYHKQMCVGFEQLTGQRAMNHYCGAYAGVQHWGATTMGDNGGGTLALAWMLN